MFRAAGSAASRRTYGTAAGSLLEAEIVTADGAVRIVNACSDPELFWGIKGGGGGSLGVVTRLTLKTHDLPDWFGGAFMTIAAASDAAFRRLIGGFIDLYRNRLFNPYWGESVAFRHDNTLAISMVSQGLDRSAGGGCLAAVPRLGRRVAARACAGPGAGDPQHAGAQVVGRRRFGGSILPATVKFDDRPGAPMPTICGGRGDARSGGLVPAWLRVRLAAGVAAAQQESLADALFAASRHWSVGLHFNKGLAGGLVAAATAARDTATNPAMLDAFALAIIGGFGPSAYSGTPDLAAARRDARAIGAAMAELRKVAPDAGAYVSESSFFQSDWQRAYWGRNYPRLRAVKARYDPDGLFFVHHGVGSEDWSDDGFTRVNGR